MKKKNFLIIIISILSLIYNFNYFNNKNFTQNKYSYLKEINTTNKINNLKKESTLTIITNLMKITLNNDKGEITKIELLKFNDNFEKNKKFFLFKNDNKNTYKIESGFKNKNFPNKNTRYKLHKVINGYKQIQVIFKSENKKIKFLKTFTFKNDNYYTEIKFHLLNKSSKIINPKIYINILHDNNKTSEETKFYKPFTGFGIYKNNKKFEKININKIKNKNNIISNEGWIAFIQHYFTSVLIMPKNSINSFFIKKINDNLSTIGNILETKNILPKHSLDITFGLYSGPQDLNLFKEINSSLILIKNYGKFIFFTKPIYWLLLKIHLIINNWGWNIILLTLIIKLFFLPITIYTQKNLNKLNLIFNNKENINKNQFNSNYIIKKFLKLYKKKKINFLFNIIFTIFQFLIFLSLFSILSNSIEFKNSPWILWIKDLSLPDPYLILPIIVSVTLFIQSNINLEIKKNNFSINISSLLISILFFFITSHMSSSIMLYWIINNIFSILQQIIFLK